MANLNELKKKFEDKFYQSYLSNSFLEKICEIMEKKNITNTELAEKMGVSKSQISRLLSDNRNLTVKTLAKLFFFLGEELEVITKSEFHAIKCSYEDTASEITTSSIPITIPKQAIYLPPGSASIPRVATRKTMTRNIKAELSKSMVHYI